ncbi:MAG: EVE domain-containing protein [Chloroflexi bacterium]|nr:EVE domain-containing protein [Chloroflexota bacterium]
MAKSYWLVKSEPGEYAYDDLVRDKMAEWDGVRNYQARNNLRAMRTGDGVLFYHSSTDPLEIVGTATVAREAHPDKSAMDKKSDHYDPKSTPENPIWYVVDLKPDMRFRRPVSVQAIRANPALANMVLLKRGRLSVQPVTEAEWSEVVRMGK